jgi:hypothetical protein
MHFNDYEAKILHEARLQEIQNRQKNGENVSKKQSRKKVK